MIGFVDVSTGAAGDKMVGALLMAAEELGLCTRAEFAAKFEALVPGIAIDITDGIDNGISGLRMHVDWKDAEPHVHVHEGEDAHGHDHGHTHAHDHDHSHGHDHGHGRPHHHEHDHDHGLMHVHGHEHVHEHDHEDMHSREHSHEHGHSHEHRSWKDIRGMIEGWGDDGSLTKGAVERALGAFSLVASAESRVHGMTIDDVGFHEVGAIDSIVDIVGASYLLDLLNVEGLYSSPIVTGYGTVDCAHGTLPVPAPATALLLEGLPIEQGAYEGEMTTPTGAALLHFNVTGWVFAPAMIPRAVGYGLGTRQIPGTSNCLRVILGDLASDESPVDSEGFSVERCALLQANVDHINPEMLASCVEDLMDEGALDVWQKPISMKKGRLGIELNVLAKLEDLDRLARKVCLLTGSLGVRRSIVERTVAARSQHVIDTEFGKAAFKVMEAGDPAMRPYWVRPEHEDIRRISKETGIPYAEVRDRLMKAWDATM